MSCVVFLGHLVAFYGVDAAEVRIGESLIRVHPAYAARRRHDMDRQTHPLRYVCAGFGQNLHVDQVWQNIDFLQANLPKMFYYSIYKAMRCLIVERETGSLWHRFYNRYGKKVPFYITGLVRGWKT